jgi:hypothetical protein
MRTTATPFEVSVVRFIHYSASARGAARLDRVVLQPFSWRASSRRPRLIRDFTVPSGSRAIGDFLVRELLQIAQHDGGAQRSRQRFQRLLQTVPQILVLGQRVGRALPRRRLQVEVSTSRAIVCRSFRTLR